MGSTKHKGSNFSSALEKCLLVRYVLFLSFSAIASVIPNLKMRHNDRILSLSTYCWQNLSCREQVIRLIRPVPPKLALPFCRWGSGYEATPQALERYRGRRHTSHCIWAEFPFRKIQSVHGCRMDNLYHGCQGKASKSLIVNVEELLDEVEFPL